MKNNKTMLSIHYHKNQHNICLGYLRCGGSMKNMTIIIIITIMTKDKEERKEPNVSHVD